MQSLSQRAVKTVTLATVPETEFTRWRELGLTHIWAMGVWTVGPRVRSLALQNEHLRRRFDELVPDWREENIPGSPYAIGDYQVPDELGGEAGLRLFRQRLHAHGLKLILDFVPNHLGLDHKWVVNRPELFVRSGVEVPGTFSSLTHEGLHWLAHGRDPNFPPWSDTAQIDYRRADSRDAMKQLLQSVAARCDGVRCDMAMLLLNDVFAKTWAHLQGGGNESLPDFWAESISAVRREFPVFLFLAEAYWGLEESLHSLGFDFVYDKNVYDSLVEHRYAELQKQLFAMPIDRRAARAHFLENHDERRIASTLSPAKHRAAALLMLGLPGMRMLYEGQLEGWRRQVPVQLGRWPKETIDEEIHSMYRRILDALKMSAVGRGKAQFLKVESVAGNQDVENVVIVQWQNKPREIDLVVVNLADRSCQCRVRVETDGLAAQDWETRDLLGVGVQKRRGVELTRDGLRLNVEAHGAHLVRLFC